MSNPPNIPSTSGSAPVKARCVGPRRVACDGTTGVGVGVGAVPMSLVADGGVVVSVGRRGVGLAASVVSVGVVAGTVVV